MTTVITGTSLEVDSVIVTTNTGLDTDTLFIDAANDRIGIGTTSPNYKLHVNGSFAATTKSFVIDHPTKPDMKLRYGSLEGPENGVYVRGKLEGKSTIELPDYWWSLIDERTDVKDVKRTSYNTKGGIYYDPNTNQPSIDQSKAFRKNYIPMI